MMLTQLRGDEAGKLCSTGALHRCPPPIAVRLGAKESRKHTGIHAIL